MEQRIRKYPVGVQTFEKIATEHYHYVDKTGIMYNLTHKYDYVFLSRPRRFGKSLLVSTLKNYFRGNRDLFKGLAIDSLEHEWKRYPVIHISFGAVKSTTIADISSEIREIFEDIEHELGIESGSDTPGGMLRRMISRCHEKYGEQVVILIDEYDAPLLNNLDDEQTLADVRKLMRSVYAPLKDSLEYIKFLFITGITKFSQLSIFSELNNLANISMNPIYATICGITEKEMEENFGEGIADMAKSYDLSREQMIGKLREYYDGYHFTENSEAVYNPFSLVQAFAANKLDYYWFSSGTPSYLLSVLRKYDTRITDIELDDVGADEFDVPTEAMHSATPILYQSGYLTIKSYDKLMRTYTLDFPNTEVKVGLVKTLFPNYVATNVSPTRLMTQIVKPLLAGDLDAALEFLRRFLKSIPYQEGTRRSEGHYTAMLYVIFALTADYVQSQVRTADGRLDILLTLPERNYLMELKLDSTAAEALAQIDSKDYSMAVTNSLPTTKVGINFSTETGTITDWLTDCN